MAFVMYWKRKVEETISLVLGEEREGQIIIAKVSHLTRNMREMQQKRESS